MNSLRVVALFLSSLAAGSVAHAQLSNGPTDRAGLLDYCRAVEIVKQPPETIRLLSEKQYQEFLNKYQWSLGYMQAMMDATFHLQVTLAVADQFGVALSGPVHDRDAIKSHLQIACFPPYATADDLMFVLNRWLTEHPKRLNERRSDLILEALGSFFACDKVWPKPGQKTAAPTTN
jgi:Ssp1 endopeptidase immunity protein Rap1a